MLVSVATFRLQWRSWVVVKEIVWPSKLEEFIISPFAENIAWPMVWKSKDVNGPWPSCHSGWIMDNLVGAWWLDPTFFSNAQYRKVIFHFLLTSSVQLCAHPVTSLWQAVKSNFSGKRRRSLPLSPPQAFAELFFFLRTWKSRDPFHYLSQI